MRHSWRWDETRRWKEASRSEVENTVQEERGDRRMRGWVIKLLTVCLGTAGAWWAVQIVTTATAGDRRMGRFFLGGREGNVKVCVCVKVREEEWGIRRMREDGGERRDERRHRCLQVEELRGCDAGLRTREVPRREFHKPWIRKRHLGMSGERLFLPILV